MVYILIYQFAQITITSIKAKMTYNENERTSLYNILWPDVRVYIVDRRSTYIHH